MAFSRRTTKVSSCLPLLVPARLFQTIERMTKEWERTTFLLFWCLFFMSQGNCVARVALQLSPAPIQGWDGGPGPAPTPAKVCALLVGSGLKQALCSLGRRMDFLPQFHVPVQRDGPLEVREEVQGVGSCEDITARRRNDCELDLF